MNESAAPGLQEQLRPFIEPRSVALIGASRRTGEGTMNILANLLEAGYQGRLYPVNPGAAEVLGLKAYPSVMAVAGEVDLAVIAVPREKVLAAAGECVDKGIRAITVVAQGFADAGAEGRRWQDQLVALARGKGARVIGPNTFGTANAFLNFSSAFVRTKMARLPLGLVCQTGVFFAGFPGLDLMGKGFDLGNACDVDPVDALEYFADDPQVRLITMHIEGLGRGRRFLEVASRVARQKPLLVWKTGASERGARMARSHTGTITGSDEVWGAALRRCGAWRVSDLDELRDAVKAASLPAMKGRNLGVISFTGAWATMALDACARGGLAAPPLGGRARDIIQGMAPPWFKAGNPVDIWPMIGSLGAYAEMSRGLRAAFRAVLSDRRVDALLFIGGAFSLPWTADMCQLLAETAAEFPDKPVAACFYGVHSDKAGEALASLGRAVVFPSVERAVRALARLAELHKT